MSSPQDNQWKCRACAQTCGESEQINGLVFFHLKKTIYTELTNLEAFDDDDLPKCLCSKCSDLLDRFKNFKEICIKSVQDIRNTIILDVKEEIYKFSDSELLHCELYFQDDEPTTNDSHFAQNATPEIVQDPRHEQEKQILMKRVIITEVNNENAMNSNEILPMKRKRIPVVPFVGQLLKSKIKSCGKKIMKLKNFEGHQLKHAGVDVSVTAINSNGISIVKPDVLPFVGQLLKNSGDYQCLVEGCGEKFIRQETEDHQLKHDDVDITVCDICKKQFCSYRSMLRHKSTVHKAKPQLTEVEIDFGLAKKRKRNKQPRKQMLHSCTFEGCNRKFLKQENRDLHFRKHKGENPLACTICSRPLSNFRRLLGHMRTHENAEKRSDKFKCPECNRTYTGKESFKAHMKIHSGEQHICELCGKAFTTGFSAHMLTHVSAEPEKCKDCDKTFTTKSRLLFHTYSEHTKNIEIAKNCLICNRKFKNQKQYYNHCKTEHTVYTTTENIFACLICPKKFKSKQILRNHAKLHSNERKYICKICPKTFAHSSLLKKHEFFHSGDRPVHCEICNKGFYQKCALEIHMNIHKRQWIAEGQLGITLHVYPRNKKKTVEKDSDEDE